MQKAASRRVGVRQPVLPLSRPRPGDGRRRAGEGPDGGVVFVFGLATFVYAAGDETGRRLAAVQLVTSGVAAAGEVAAALGPWGTLLARGRRLHPGRGGRAVRERTGPRGPTSSPPGWPRGTALHGRGCRCGWSPRGDRGVHRDGADGAGSGRPPPRGARPPSPTTSPCPTTWAISPTLTTWAARRARNANQGADT